MGNGYTRQSTYNDGDVINASDSNDEFNALADAFDSITGHTHDGTTGEGGPITTLSGNAITIGDGSAGNDIVVTFNGECTASAIATVSNIICCSVAITSEASVHRLRKGLLCNTGSLTATSWPLVRPANAQSQSWQAN